MNGGCNVDAEFAPGAAGERSATVTPVGNFASPNPVTLTGLGTEGYFMTTSGGLVVRFGDAQLGPPDPYRTTSNVPSAPVAGIASDGSGYGAWLTTTKGQVITTGSAFYEGEITKALNKPIVGIASTPDGSGYWLVASDGGIFSFGDAPYLGSGGSYNYTTVVGMAMSGSSTLQATLDVPALRTK